MGIDVVTLHSLLMSSKYFLNFDRCLTLGIQHIHMWPEYYEYIVRTYGIETKFSKTCENLLYKLGFKNVDSIDYSDYEKCSIIHDLNKPIKDEIKNKFDFILDGGTIEHVFNIPQVFDNIVKLLKKDGVFCSVACNNNFSGHGFYQFSPEIFLSSFTTDYGMKVEEIYIAEVDTFPDSWIKIDKPDPISSRMTDKINTYKEVYIVVFARKIKDDADIKKNFIDHPPNQISYETEWNVSNKK